MLSEKDFDDWAGTYDESVECTEAADAYPFAGYDRVMNAIFERVTTVAGARVLDLGFGTATLTKRLYDAGCEVYGQDFSARMVEVAQEKMPGALLVQRDFSSGLAPELASRTYDAIVATYSLHHLDDKGRRGLIGSLIPLLSEGGCLYIGDVAFETRRELEQCRAAVGDAWDPDEIYFVYDELRNFFPAATFERMSSCSGIISIPSESRC
ncbi:class I SAM-dependent methyltransferase [Thermophilibacter provencensis]|uniref:Class I SAM-dependent methyltransferase n=1 Tax=Thermophilibacter provencensis TaxID=1852386 RepID=A0ABT7V2Y4_9ACTN|nr:class I SAM-dependent methyltransferase [Thermophilibacter provencensis]MDM8270965.1 class I SAM-dependent methyltransferase [Thermophilibacter provencensis]